MPIYAIRHKQSGELMPIFKRNKGYSLWKRPTKSFLDQGNIWSNDGSIDPNTVRCFTTFNKAKKVVRERAKNIKCLHTSPEGCCEYALLARAIPGDDLEIIELEVKR